MGTSCVVDAENSPSLSTGDRDVDKTGRRRKWRYIVRSAGDHGDAVWVLLEDFYHQFPAGGILGGAIGWMKKLVRYIIIPSLM